jgi:hypothetical protein
MAYTISNQHDETLKAQHRDQPRFQPHVTSGALSVSPAYAIRRPSGHHANRGATGRQTLAPRGGPPVSLPPKIG